MNGCMNWIVFNRRDNVEPSLLEPESQTAGPCKKIDADRAIITFAHKGLTSVADNGGNISVVCSTYKGAASADIGPAREQQRSHGSRIAS
jgi:hypothetical protein